MQGFTLSSGIGEIPNIEKFLGVERLTRNPLCLVSQSCKAAYSWGHKPYSKKAARLAKLFSLPHVRVEDGFVCSFGNRRQNKYSLVIDPQGIYYDATTPSRLENILNGLESDSCRLDDPVLIAEAEELMQKLIECNISKYNTIGESAFSANDESEFVLVIDQTSGDQSVHFGGMQADDFVSMLQHALTNNDPANVLVKVHPDVLEGRKKGYLSEQARAAGVRLISGDIPAHKLALCRRAYVGTSLYGFELLMRGVEVVCFGQPFYAGWGLTKDQKPISRRQKKRSLTEMFIAAYLLYPKYIDPVTGMDSTLVETIDHIMEQRRQYNRVGDDYRLLGITLWKRGYIDRYAMTSEFKHQHIKLKQLQEWSASASNDQPSVMVWGRGTESSPAEQALDKCKVARIEDGFVRSVGLGSNFTAPRSLIVDDLGIYFDATQPSRLEYLLENRDCSDLELQRAESVIQMLLQNRISKYTATENNETDTSFYQGKSVHLVVGQVQGDASLRYGAEDINSNFRLLEKVRQENPDVVIVYKPHPDVVSGNRSDGIDNYHDINPFCDHVETELSIEVTFSQCDIVHTMTSLAGLEALLCGKQVVTYGKPFYAGWGLTTDLCFFERRTRKRTLAELVFISYIEYPGYLDIESGEFTSVEKTIAALVEERRQCNGSITATGLKKYANIVRNIRKGLTYAA